MSDYIKMNRLPVKSLKTHIMKKRRMKTGIFMLTIFAVLVTAARGSDPPAVDFCIGATELYGDWAKEKEVGTNLLASLKGKLRGRGYTIAVPEESERIADFDPENRDHLKMAKTLARDYNAEYCLVARALVIDPGKEYGARVFLVSSKKRKLVYRTSVGAKPGAVDTVAETVAGRVHLFIEGNIPDYQLTVAAADGDNTEDTMVAWEGDGFGEYALYRTSLEGAPPLRIGETGGETEFADKDGIPGLRYWYYPVPVVDGVDLDPLYSDTGYRKAPEPESIDLDRELRQKNKKAPRYPSEEERGAVRENLEYLEQFLKHPVELNIIMMIAKRYIRKGKILALNDFDDYEINYLTRITLLKQRDMKYAVMFNSGKLARCFFEIEKVKKMKGPGGSDLVDRLVRNSIAFAIPRGVKEVKDWEGRLWHIPYFEAVGLSTEYYRDYAKWKSMTMLFGTSNEELDQILSQTRGQ